MNVRQKIFEKVVDFVVKHGWIKIFNELCSTFPSFVDAYIIRIERKVAYVELNYTEQEEKEQWEKLCKKIREYEEGLRK